MKFQIYKTKTKQWRWRLRAANGEIIAHGESYKRRKDCFRGIRLVQGSGEAPIDFPNKA